MTDSAVAIQANSIDPISLLAESIEQLALASEFVEFNDQAEDLANPQDGEFFKLSAADILLVDAICRQASLSLEQVRRRGEEQRERLQLLLDRAILEIKASDKRTAEAERRARDFEQTLETLSQAVIAHLSPQGLLAA